MLRHFITLFSIVVIPTIAFVVPTPENMLTLGATKPNILVGEESQPTVEAGFVMTLTQKFFDDYNKQMMQIFKQKMAKLAFKDACYDQSLGELLYAKLCVADQNLKQFEIDDENSRLIIDSNKKSLSLLLNGINMLFDLKFEISSTP
jgi:hypothetical protein